VQRLFVFVMNEWQLGEKDVRIVAPSKFYNGIYKVPKLSIAQINRLGSTGTSEAFFQTNINGFVTPEKIKVQLSFYYPL